MDGFIEFGRFFVMFLILFDDLVRFVFVDRSSIVQRRVDNRTDFRVDFRLARGEFLPIFACLVDDTSSKDTIAVLLVQGELVRGFAGGNFVIFKPTTCCIE